MAAKSVPTVTRPSVSAPLGSPTALGATPYDGGVRFRVWAPFAASVAVAGTFNAWSETAHPLRAEGNGYWAADVGGAAVGDAYQYVIVSDRATYWRIDPYAREVTHSAGDAIVHDPSFDWRGGGEFVTPAWHELIIYELHVGTFNDEPGGGPGSFDRVAAKLDYLRDLGVTAIELMPSMEFATDFSWGYNPAHIYAIERAYGGPRALKRLVNAAHARGIAVIFDVVYNHFGPMDLDLWRFDGWSQHAKGGIYFYNDWRSHTPWGDTRPDYGRVQVREFIRDNALMWLDEFRVDGLRWDATAYVRNVYGRDGDPGSDIADGWRLMQEVTAASAARHPRKLHIAEDLRGNEWLTRRTAQGGAGFGAQWDGAFARVVRDAVTRADDEGRDLRAVAAVVERGYNMSPFQRVIFTESHDEVANGRARVPHEIAPHDAAGWYARKRSTLGAALALTAPGIPMLFQGQELLEDEWFRDHHPIDWTRLERFAGIHAMYRDLIRLRRNWFDTTRGLRGPHVHAHHVNDAAKVLAFHRWDWGGPGDDVVVVANLSHRGYPSYTIGFPRAGDWRVRLNSDSSAYDAGFGNFFSFDTRAWPTPRDGMPCSGNVGIGPYSVIILSQNEER